jgi:uncharacterized membrane protein YccC
MKIVELLRKANRDGVAATRQSMVEHSAKLAKAHEELRRLDGEAIAACDDLRQALVTKSEKAITSGWASLDRALTNRDTLRQQIEALATDLPGCRVDFKTAIRRNIKPAIMWSLKTALV